ncbi:MAG: M48 family metallopeptidase [Firmicutes bacterium]|nr:M48 family metallopeptidase [Bacillota bacterium]
MADLRRKTSEEVWNVQDLSVRILRKRIKNLHLYVKPPEGRVEVTVPHWLSEGEILRFIEGKMAWIRKQRERILQRDFSLQEDYLSGDMLHLWGQAYPLSIQEGTSYALSLDSGRAVFTVRQGSSAAQRETWIREWYRGILKAAIEERLPVWENLTGLFCREWNVKDMTTRWGTCNPSAGRIWINLQLARKTPECLDYVLLHELAHLKIANHGADFGVFMDRYMPSWREIRKTLKN